jgi:hypothetical protein
LYHIAGFAVASFKRGDCHVFAAGDLATVQDGARGFFEGEGIGFHYVGFEFGGDVPPCYALALAGKGNARRQRQ